MPRLLVLTAAVTGAVLVARAQAQDPAAPSPARFAALDTVYVASLPLDRNPSAAQVAELRSVCGALDAGDRVLAAARRSCLTAVDAVGPSQACTTAEAGPRRRRAARVRPRRRPARDDRRPWPGQQRRRGDRR